MSNCIGSNSMFCNIIESLLSSFTLCLYNHYLLQDVIVRNFSVVTDIASATAGNVTTMMTVVITATNKIVVCISYFLQNKILVFLIKSLDTKNNNAP